jgi:hypothetical protein
MMAVPVPSCCVLNQHDLFYQIENALAFNRDRCCHLALCLRFLPFNWNEASKKSISNTFQLAGTRATTCSAWTTGSTGRCSRCRKSSFCRARRSRRRWSRRRFRRRRRPCRWFTSRRQNTQLQEPRGKQPALVLVPFSKCN